jgi:hypothetical protein
MSNRPNWYHETGPERRAKRRHRFRSLWIWLFVIAVAIVVLSQGGGPFAHGSTCETSTHVDSSTGLESTRLRCHEVRSWVP